MHPYNKVEGVGHELGFHGEYKVKIVLMKYSNTRNRWCTSTSRHLQCMQVACHSLFHCKWNCTGTYTRVSHNHPESVLSTWQLSHNIHGKSGQATSKYTTYPWCADHSSHTPWTSTCYRVLQLWVVGCLFAGSSPTWILWMNAAFAAPGKQIVASLFALIHCW